MIDHTSVTSATFQEKHRSRFLSLAAKEGRGAYRDVWNVAFKKFQRNFLNANEYEQYVEDLITLCDDPIVRGLGQKWLDRILDSWHWEIERRVTKFADEFSNGSRPSVERTKLSSADKRSIREWAQALQQLRQIPTMEYVGLRLTSFFVLNLRPNQLLTFDELRLDDLAATLRRIRKQEDSSVRFRLDGHEPDEQSLRIEFRAPKKRQSIAIDLAKETFDSSDFMDLIAKEIIYDSKKRFGELGESYACSQLRFHHKEPKHKSHGRKRGPGRPADVFINKLILRLDAEMVNRTAIKRISDALEGKKTRIGHKNREDGPYQPRKGHYQDQTTLNSRKAIDKRLRDLGGNYLRYLADLAIEKNEQCEKCRWAWNTHGLLVRFTPCAAHRTIRREPPLDFVDKDLFDGLITKRGRKYFSNALG